MTCKVTVITPSKNSAATIEDTLKSVQLQTYGNIEHIVVDGGSNDGTDRLCSKDRFPRVRFLRSKDRSMYDAINKGLAVSSGEIIAVLNSDDIYADTQVIADVVQAFELSGADGLYGDIVYVKHDDLGKIVRYWRASQGGRRDVQMGWMPPHTAFFIKKSIYDRFGGYDIRYRIASDYEMIVRLVHDEGIKTVYLPRLCTKMRVGGMSNGNLSCMFRKSSEDLMVCRAHGLRYPVVTVALKNVRKIGQFFMRKGL